MLGMVKTCMDWVIRSQASDGFVFEKIKVQACSSTTKR